ncbi:MAG: DNA/RNA non-specific endonuclease, partial [Planctomycetes bacterium]|nr:DNA/RNA non-specific endonuclease [Planctomycetota bacterium]
TGNIGRLHSFKLDKDVPERCQQTSNKTYSHSTEKYDRGHLVPANHLDHLEAGIRESNFMINVLPQARNMGTGDR